MEKMRTLVANDPPVYRELISEAFKRLRPLMETTAALPEQLEEAARRVRPHLVICSGPLGAVVRCECLAWVGLYPDGEDRAETAPPGAIWRCWPAWGWPTYSRWWTRRSFCAGRRMIAVRNDPIDGSLIQKERRA